MLNEARLKRSPPLNGQERNDPDALEIVPLSPVPAESREFFKCPGSGVMRVLPELGSRAFLGLWASGARHDVSWLDVQDKRYRYLIGQRQRTTPTL